MEKNECFGWKGNKIKKQKDGGISTDLGTDSSNRIEKKMQNQPKNGRYMQKMQRNIIKQTQRYETEKKWNEIYNANWYQLG